MRFYSRSSMEPRNPNQEFSVLCPPPPPNLCPAGLLTIHIITLLPLRQKRSAADVWLMSRMPCRVFLLTMLAAAVRLHAGGVGPLLNPQAQLLTQNLDCSSLPRT